MNSYPKTSSSNFYIVPVKLNNQIYEMLPDAGEPELCDEGFLRYLSKNHKKKLHEVSIDNLSAKGIVFIANDLEDCSFAAVDAQMNPIGAVDESRTIFDIVKDYFNRLRKLVASSDSIIPAQATYLPFDYVIPNLQKLQEPFSSLSISDLMQFKQVMVFGEAGAGKTCLLRHIVLEMTESVEDDSSHDKPVDNVPVYISLRHITKQYDFSTTMLNTIRNNCPEWVQANYDKLNKSGNFTLLLDGLDEVTTYNRNKITDWVTSHIKAYPKARVIITCRPQIEGSHIDGFECVTIKPFDLERVRDFAYRKLYGKKSWRSFVSCYRESTDMQTVLTNPLMLNIATYMYYQHNIIPPNTAQLLKEFVNALTETWDSSRGVIRYDDKILAPEKLRNYLGRLAIGCVETESNIFDEKQASDWLEVEESIDVTADYLAKIRDVTGLICNIADKGYSFKHNIIMYYLAANYVLERAEGISGFFNKHHNSKTWEHIWDNVSGSTSDPKFIYELYSRKRTGSSNEIGKRIASLALQSVFMSPKTANSCISTIVQSVQQDFEHFKLTVKPFDEEDIGDMLNDNGEIVITYSKTSSTDDADSIMSLLSKLTSLRWTSYQMDVCKNLEQNDNPSIRALSRIMKVNGTMSVFKSDNSLTIRWLPEAPEMPWE